MEGRPPDAGRKGTGGEDRPVRMCVLPVFGGERGHASSEKERRSDLTLWIFAGIFAAGITSLAALRLSMKMDVGGGLFLRLLNMMVVPLVVATVMSGILGLGDVRSLGRPYQRRYGGGMPKFSQDAFVVQPYSC